MRRRDLVSLLSLSSWCLVIVVWLFFVVPWVCLQLVILVFPNHTHLLFLIVCLSILSRSEPKLFIKQLYLEVTASQTVPACNLLLFLVANFPNLLLFLLVAESDSLLISY